MQQEDRSVLRPSGALTEAIDRRNNAAREAGRWQTVLERTPDKYARRYFEGHIELSNLRAVHYNLVAQSSMRTGREPESKPHQISRTPVIRAKASLEISLAEKGRDKAVTQWNAHHVKAAALTMLAARCRELGMESMAHGYEARASLEAASARGFDGVIKGYDKQLQDLGVREKTREESSSLQNSLDRLERAQRLLEDYNKSHARAMGHMRKCRQIETEIQSLGKDPDAKPSERAGHEKIEESIYQRDMVSSLAEKEALAAARCHRDFRQEIQAAHKSYDALSLALTGTPLKTISSAPDMDHHGKAQTPALVAAEKRPPDVGISKPHESDSQTGQPDTKHTSTSTQPYRSVAVGVVVGQLVRELERGL